MGFTDYEEVQRNQRQKISRAKPPKKSKHKHVYEPCILEYNGLRFSKEHGMTYDKPEAKISAYCPVCGKIGDVEDRDRWIANVKSGGWYWSSEPTEEYVRELNPETRTLPTFWVDDPYFPKFVTLPEEEENLLSAPKEPLCPSMRR